VIAWADDFTGYVVDYGTYPKQSRTYFVKGDRGLHTIQTTYPQHRTNAAIQQAIQDALQDILSIDWTMEGDDDGTVVVKFSKIFIDSGYQPKEVENAIRMIRSPIVEPTLGRGVKSSQKPLMTWQRKAGRHFGTYWMEERPTGRSLKTVTFDANYWKCQVHSALGLAAGSRGGLTLWGAEPDKHRMFSEHLTAEIAKLVKTNDIEVNEWVAIPGRDNHLFDCIVGNFVAASYLGVKTPDEKNVKVIKHKRRIS
jgi:hypothetical protein